MAEHFEGTAGSVAGGPESREGHDAEAPRGGWLRNGGLDGMVITTDAAADRTTVSLVGELDLASAPHVRWTLAQVGGQAIVVDLSRLTFIDATGMSSLLIVRRHLKQMGRTLVLTGARGPVRRVFEMSGLGHLVAEAA